MIIQTPDYSVAYLYTTHPIFDHPTLHHTINKYDIESNKAQLIQYLIGLKSICALKTIHNTILYNAEIDNEKKISVLSIIDTIIENS